MISEPAPPKKLPRARLRRYLLLLAVVVTLGGGVMALILGFRQRTPSVALPDMDYSNTDPAVQRVITLAREKVLSEPHSAKTWGHLGMVPLAHTFLPESGACFHQAEQRDGRDPRWPYLRALAVRRADPETAIVELRRTVELCGEEPDSPRLLLGELLFQQGNLDEAKQQFLSILLQNPTNGRAHLGLGRIEYEREALTSSVSHYRQAAADSRTRKMSLIQLAEAYQRLGDSDAAAIAQNEANELPKDPAWPDPFAEQYTSLTTGENAALNRAFMLLGSDRVSEALEMLLGTLREYPNSAQGWLLMGRALIRQRDVPPAELALRRSIRLKADSPEAQFYLGVALFLQKKPKEALPFFRKATELQPDYPFAHYNVGECLRQLNDVPGAIDALQTALHCQPAFADAHLALGELFSQQGQATEACDHLRQALRLRPQEARARKLLDQLHCSDTTAPTEPGSPKAGR